MRQFLLFLTFFFSTLTYGQFAIICDKDGYTNVRTDSEKGNNIADKLQNGHLIYCLDDKGNWTNIDYLKNKKELNGYIYEGGYTLISNYQAIPMLTEENNLVKLAKDSIEVVIAQKTFDRSKHKYRYFKEAKDQIELIDNKKYWGTDGETPKTEYKSITVKIGQKVFELPFEALDNLYEPSLYNTQVNFNKKKNVIYIQSVNSDGAGAYEVIWKIESGIYKDRLIAYGF